MRRKTANSAGGASGVERHDLTPDRQVVRLHEMTAVILCGGMGTRLRVLLPWPSLATHPKGAHASLAG